MQKQRMEQVIAASRCRTAHPQHPQPIERLAGRASRHASGRPATDGALALLDVVEDVATLDTEPLVIPHKGAAESRILIVEDDPRVAEMVRTALELEGEPGWAVHVASEGQHALDLAATVAPQVVLLDVRLPDLDGAEIYRRLRSNPRMEQTRILFLTAATSHDLHQQGIEGGVLLRKPFDVHEVASLVRALLTADSH